jgi:hypothetical protein
MFAIDHMMFRVMEIHVRKEESEVVRNKTYETTSN